MQAVYECAQKKSGKKRYQSSDTEEAEGAGRKKRERGAEALKRELKDKRNKKRCEIRKSQRRI